MFELSLYSLLAVFFLGLPLYLYKHPLWLVLLLPAAELLFIFLAYSSTIMMCSEGENCGGSWNWIIPALIATMNIGMLWPVLAGYAKQAELDRKQACKNQDESRSD